MPFGMLLGRGMRSSDVGAPRLKLRDDAPTVVASKEDLPGWKSPHHNPNSLFVSPVYFNVDGESGIYRDPYSFEETSYREPAQDTLRRQLKSANIPFAEVTDVQGNCRIRYEDRKTGSGLTTSDSFFTADGYMVGSISVDPYYGSEATVGSCFEVENLDPDRKGINVQMLTDLMDDYGLKTLTTIDTEFAIRDKLAFAVADKAGLVKTAEDMAKQPKSRRRSEPRLDVDLSDATPLSAIEDDLLKIDRSAYSKERGVSLDRLALRTDAAIPQFAVEDDLLKIDHSARSKDRGVSLDRLALRTDAAIPLSKETIEVIEAYTSKSKEGVVESEDERIKSDEQQVAKSKYAELQRLMEKADAKAVAEPEEDRAKDDGPARGHIWD